MTDQVCYNLLNPSAGQAVPKGFYGQDFGNLVKDAADRDMGVVVIRVMAGGAIGGPAARKGNAAPSIGSSLAAGGDYESDAGRASSLNSMVAHGVASLPEAAVRFALMNRAVSTVLVGFSDRGQIDSAAASSNMGPLPQSAMERLQALWTS